MLTSKETNTASTNTTMAESGLGQGQVKSGPLDEKSRGRLEDFLNEVQSGGDYFKMQDGQSAELTFDLENIQTGYKTRKIKTGEEITRFTFALWNPQLRRRQLWKLSNTWAKRALQAMKEFNTNTLIVRRSGSTMQSTDYSFLPSGLKWTSPSDEHPSLFHRIPVTGMIYKYHVFYLWT